MSSPELRSSLMVRFNRYRKSGAARRVGWEGGTPTQVSTSSETVFEFRPEIATCAIGNGCGKTHIRHARNLRTYI